jgi:actin-related protein 8
LIVNDDIQRVEIKWFLNILLNRLDFKSVLIHKESVLATYGAGVTNVCVVTLNEDFTSVSVVEEGFCKKKSFKYLP